MQNPSHFKNFVKITGFIHKTGVPFHAETNGLAENAVKTVKNGIKKAKFDKSNQSFKTILNKFLFQYRISVHSTTQESPSKLLLNRNCKTRFDLLLPKNRKEIVNKNQITNYL